MISLLAAVMLSADGGAGALYSAATTEPHGLIQLELAEGGATGRYRQVISIHLPPTELEALDVKVTSKGDTLCLKPAPRAIEPCGVKKGDTLEVTLKATKSKLVLERR